MSVCNCTLSPQSCSFCPNGNMGLPSFVYVYPKDYYVVITQKVNDMLRQEIPGAVLNFFGEDDESDLSE